MPGLVREQGYENFFRGEQLALCHDYHRLGLLSINIVSKLSQHSSRTMPQPPQPKHARQGGTPGTRSMHMDCDTD